MGLPLLKDFLPAGGALDADPAPSGGGTHLDRHETIVLEVERRIGMLQNAVEDFISTLQRGINTISEEDIVKAFEQIEAEARANEPLLAERIEAAREGRRRITRLRPGSPREASDRAAALHLFDREIAALERARVALEWGREQTEALRDVVLVRETQEFSSSALWGDGDDDYY
jgi:hypothetical protein